MILFYNYLNELLNQYSLNEYLYTANNPINRIDPDGDSWKKYAAYGVLGLGIALSFTGIGSLAGAMAVGAASGALMDGSSAYLNGKRGSSLFKAVGTGALIGAATTGVGWGAGKVITGGVKYKIIAKNSGSGDTVRKLEIGKRIKIAQHSSHSVGPHNFSHIQMFKGQAKKNGKIVWKTIKRIRLK